MTDNIVTPIENVPVEKTSHFNKKYLMLAAITVSVFAVSYVLASKAINFQDAEIMDETLAIIPDSK